jgi:hypothetical protein
MPGLARSEWYDLTRDLSRESSQATSWCSWYPSIPTT